MRQETLTLLDFMPTDGLGETLREVLEESFKVHTVFRGSYDDFSGRGRDGEPPALTRSGDSPLVLLVLPRGEFEHAGAVFRSLREGAADLPLVVVTEAGEPGEMYELLRLGATDFITPPLKSCDILPRLWRILEQTRREAAWTRKLKEKLGLKQLVGESPAFLAEVQKFPLVARCDASVLISGETGTGKEVCARAIHYLSARASKPFVPVNCGAIPFELIENELFGHERGAYTGASSARRGLIPEADGGTLFMDEVDSLPPLAQVKLLRFLQEKEYRPLGSTKTHKADVRVIAASNSDFEEAVKEGRLRRDLYYRLNVMPLVLPPMRERPEDVWLLANHFLDRYSAEYGKEVTGFATDAMRKLEGYGWPGNVRELEHIVARSVMLCAGAVIQHHEVVLPVSEDAPSGPESFRAAKARVVAQFEKSYIQQLLSSHAGNITKAAQTAGKNRRAFWQLVRKYRIDVRRFKTCEP